MHRKIGKNRRFGILIVIISVLSLIFTPQNTYEPQYKLLQFNPLFATLTFLFKVTPDLHAEMWNYSESIIGWNFPIDASDVYYNITNLSVGEISEKGWNFTNESQINGGSFLTAKIAGLYEVDFSISISSGAKVLSGFAAVKNFDVDETRSCYARSSVAATGVVANTAGGCIMNIEVGDKINMQVDDQSPPAKDINIHSASLHLTRIG